MNEVLVIVFSFWGFAKVFIFSRKPVEEDILYSEETKFGPIKVLAFIFFVIINLFLVYYMNVYDVFKIIYTALFILIFLHEMNIESRRISLTEKGILTVNKHIPWAKVESYNFYYPKKHVITLEFQIKRKYIMSATLGLKVLLEERDEVEAIVRKYTGLNPGEEIA